MLSVLSAKIISKYSSISVLACKAYRVLYTAAKMTNLSLITKINRAE